MLYSGLLSPCIYIYKIKFKLFSEIRVYLSIMMENIPTTGTPILAFPQYFHHNAPHHQIRLHSLDFNILKINHFLEGDSLLSFSIELSVKYLLYSSYYLYYLYNKSYLDHEVYGLAPSLSSISALCRMCAGC